MLSGIRMAESGNDLKSELLDKVLPGLDRRMRPFGDDVLILVLDRAGRKTAGGLHLPETYAEDKFQGAIGLVVALGPLCKGPQFEDWFGGDPPKVGSWVGFSVRDGVRAGLKGNVMRLIEWKYLRFGTDEPDAIV